MKVIFLVFVYSSRGGAVIKYGMLVFYDCFPFYNGHIPGMGSHITCFIC